MNTKPPRIGRKAVITIGAMLALSAMGWAVSAQADDAVAAPAAAPSATAESVATVSAGAEATMTIELAPGKAKKISFLHKITKVNILAPDIASYVVLDVNEVLVTAGKPGTTQMIVWDETQQTHVLDINVSSPIMVLRHQLQTLFPDSKINAEETAGNITLTGQVHNLETANEASQLATLYGPKVLNLLEVAGGQQVMLKVKFCEVSKQAESELGFNFGGTDGTSFFSANLGKNPFTLAATPSPIPGSGLASTLTSASMFGQGAAGSLAFQYFVDALQNNSVLRMLAEPNLITTSGQEASFLAGGQIPYPVPQAGTGGQTTITIQFQQYGVQLNFTPIVLGDGRIRLKVAPDISALDYSNSVSVAGTSVPGLTERKVDTTVELAEGQTFAIAGLLQDTVSATNIQFPVLGDVPVLGALFRSVQYTNNQTEMVVLVTPVLVHGMNPGDVTRGPGEKWHDPSEWELFALKNLGGEMPEPKASSGPAPRFHGAYGFQPPAMTPAAGK